MITTPGPTHQAIPHTTREAIRRQVFQARHCARLA